MTELEKVRQFVKENGIGQKYVLNFEHKWKGYNVYVWYFSTPHECTGPHPLTVLVKNGEMRCATEKEIDKIMKYQDKFYVEDDKYGDDRWYFDMQSLNIISESCLELKEKMKTCSDEKELTLFYEDIIDRKYKKAYEEQLRKSKNK